MIIREEQSGDLAAIRRVILEAFDGPAEADLVEKLRANGKFRLSLVAELDGQVVGHILFTVVSIEDADPCPRTLGLAPLAVLSEFQRKGIGSALMHSSLERCREMGHDAIVVVGHPEYYPKFGFLPASRSGSTASMTCLRMFSWRSNYNPEHCRGLGVLFDISRSSARCNRGVAVFARSSAGTVTTASSKPTVFPRKRE